MSSVQPGFTEGLSPPLNLALSRMPGDIEEKVEERDLAQDVHTPQ